MRFDRSGLTDDTLLDLYSALLRPRMIEEKMLVLLRQGRVSKWFSGIGQEAISVGATAALKSNEWIMPLHRNLGVFTGRGMPFGKLFKQWQGKRDGYSKARERSFHFGSVEHHVCGMISHLGPQLAIACGTALASKLRGEARVSLAFTGDGGTSEGDFHEALNVAAVWGLPVIFLIENNGYGLSTPTAEQYVCRRLADRAEGYGMKSRVIDGNNILEVYRTVQEARDYCLRKGRPILIECETFRMRGHEEASGVKYVPKELFEKWATKDPVKNYETWLLDSGLLTPELVESARAAIAADIEAGLEEGFATPPPVANSSEELHDVYAPSVASATSGRVLQPAATAEETVMGSTAADADEQVAEEILQESESDAQVASSKPSAPEKKFIAAITEALDLAMQRHAGLVLMGQDIAEYGGAFKVTEGFVEKFGKARVRNTPLCESAIVGTALGLSLEGAKAMMEMQFADFVTVGFNQIINNLAKIHYRWGQAADVVIRMPTGGGVGAGPFHSQSNEAWFVHTPGLKVVYPSTPEDAKGLLLAAFDDPNPVMFFEHKALYRGISGRVPEGFYTTPIGKARVVQPGTDVAIITYGMGVHWATEYAAAHPDTSFYILDLRTLLPLDWDAVRAAVEATGKVCILHEDTLTGGIGGEIGAWISEHCFQALDAPVVRCASLDTPVPFALELEAEFMAKRRLDEAIQKVLQF